MLIKEVKKWIHFRTGYCVGFYLLLSLVGSLGFSTLFSPDTYATTYTTTFRDYGSSQAVDLTPYMFIGENTGQARTWLQFTYCNGSPESCMYDPNYQWYRINDSNSFSAPVFTLTNVRSLVSFTNFSMIRPDSTPTDLIIPYAQFDCSGNVYVGSSVSFSSELSFDDITYNDSWRSLKGFPGFAGFYPTLTSSTYVDPSYLPGYSNINVVNTTLKYSNLSSNKTAVVIYELQPHQGTYDYFYLNSFGNDFYLSNYSSNGGTVTFNGVVAGCSESSVKNMLTGLDPSPDPVVPDNFPSSFDSLSNTNNEDAWEIMNNIDPNDFSFQNQDSNSILTWVVDFFRNIALVEPAVSSCQVYMPSFFGNKFSFGNSVDGQFLYVNLCQNNFISELWDDGSWVGSVFNSTSYGENNSNWFYIGIKGLIWVFCGWVLVRIMLGYVYWIYGFIDSIFGTGGNE